MRSVIGLGKVQLLTFDIVDDITGNVVLFGQQIKHVGCIDITFLLQPRLTLFLIVLQLIDFSSILVEANGAL